MDYNCYDMNAYKLHIIKTKKFKTITVGIAFRRKILKEEITIRNLLKDLMINSSYNYPTEKSLIIETEKLYDLKLIAANYRIGNDTILTFKTRFLNEKYTEEGMNEESIRFLLDIIFNPRLDNDVIKCKKKIEKSILQLKDNKIKYSLFKLLEDTGDMPYAYNSYGDIDTLNKISVEDIKKYYDSLIRDDIVDVYVIGDVFSSDIKKIFKEYFKITTFHKDKCEILAPELKQVRKVKEIREYDKVNQTQLTMLCSINGLTDYERKYVLPVYGEMLGGSANSILFDSVREKNSYAYYVNAIVKSYDNLMMIYSGIGKGTEDKVRKIIVKTLKNIAKGIFDNDKFEDAKRTMVAGIKASLDSPMGIINNYYAMELVNSKSVEERIKEVSKVKREDIINVSKKIKLHTVFILEATDEKDSN